MFVRHPKYRKQLSDKQSRILKLVFKFRFVSVPLLAECLGKDKSSVYEQLVGLVEQGYLLRQYDSSYRLQLKLATYALTAKGIKYLRDSTNGQLSDTALRNMYKNRTASDQLVVQSLDLFKLWLQLKQQYPDIFDVFTGSEMADATNFVRPLPDLYLQRKNKRSAKPNYFLETIEADTMSWILRKRLQAHEQWLDEHEDVWGDNYPTLLFVCGNTNTEKRIQRMVNNSYFEFEVMTTTDERLTTHEPKVWVHEWDLEWDEELAFNEL